MGAGMDLSFVNQLVSILKRLHAMLLLGLLLGLLLRLSRLLRLLRLLFTLLLASVSVIGLVTTKTARK